jgi:hypothetical protein
MARLDHKLGRFSPEYEAREFGQAMLGTFGVWGDSCEYYRFSEASSAQHDVYDEPDAAGRWFLGPLRLPVIALVREEGMPYNQEGGMYWTDTAYFKIPYASLVRAGLWDLNADHGSYTRDRVVYDDRVFRVARIQVHGQIKRTDMTAVITVTQLKPADLATDSQFDRWWRREHAQGLPSA